MSHSDKTLICQISKKHRDVVQIIFMQRGANLSKDARPLVLLARPAPGP